MRITFVVAAVVASGLCEVLGVLLVVAAVIDQATSWRGLKLVFVGNLVSVLAVLIVVDQDTSWRDLNLVFIVVHTSCFRPNLLLQRILHLLDLSEILVLRRFLNILRIFLRRFLKVLQTSPSLAVRMILVVDVT